MQVYVTIAIDKDFCDHELPCVQESKVSFIDLNGMLCNYINKYSNFNLGKDIGLKYECA